MTLIEVMVTMVISAAVVGGMGLAFSEAMRYWARESQKMQIYEDASLFLYKLNKQIRRAQFVAIYPFGGQQNARLVLDMPGNTIRTPLWRADYYYVDAEGTIRYNGNVDDRPFYHKKVLPLWDFRTQGGNDTTYFDLYKVEFTFTEAGNWPSSPGGPAMVKTELFMRSPSGDTLYMSSLNARRNRAN